MSGHAPSAMQPGAEHAVDFAQRVLQIVNEGHLTTTYKLAVLLGLMDVCMERGGVDDQAPIPVGELASKVVDLYWQQTQPHPRLGHVLH